MELALSTSDEALGSSSELLGEIPHLSELTVSLVLAGYRMLLSVSGRAGLTAATIFGSFRGRRCPPEKIAESV